MSLTSPDSGSEFAIGDLIDVSWINRYDTPVELILASDYCFEPISDSGITESFATIDTSDVLLRGPFYDREAFYYEGCGESLAFVARVWADQIDERYADVSSVELIVVDRLDLVLAE